MKISLTALLVLTVSGYVIFGARSVELAAQQAADSNWERAAGGKMDFEVASVRLNPGPMEPSNFPLSPDDAYVNTGGLLSADLTLPDYINFAYKISLTREQFQSLYGKLPSWVRSDNYEIHARAGGSPTKDQMRLMMQSLLKERFGLAVHYATEDAPVLVMSLQKQGKLGPKLHRHEDGPSCSVSGTAETSVGRSKIDIFPPECGRVVAVLTGKDLVLMGGREVTLEMMAEQLASIGKVGWPIIDETGLTGNYDFTLTWTAEPGTFGIPKDSGSQDSLASNFLESMPDQLGLKLKAGKASLKVLVIDHVERPSSN